uniref:SKP1 component POZ domain-containing protein n=1 Tax=Peromyscus maniculatus bairdii TaxID=230844 RepID=A0A8C9CR81_PERMB
MDGEEKSYGDCEGPDAMYVKLISSDGHEFIVKREHALTSGTIKAMLSGPGSLPKLSCVSVFFFYVYVSVFPIYYFSVLTPLFRADQQVGRDLAS